MCAAPAAQAAYPGENGRIGYALEFFAWGSDGAGDYAIRTVLPDGTKPRLLDLTASGRVAFSPDGRRVAYTNPFYGYISTAPLDRPRRHRPLSGPRNDGLPEWSPNGRRLAFVRTRGDNPSELWIREFPGSRHLTEGYAPTWSVNGEIAFTRATESGEEGIYAIRPDGRGLRQVRALGSSPDWSPDGRTIVFALGSDIVSIRADGSDFRQLTRGPAQDSDPSFSPDGRQIALLRNGTTILRMGRAGRNLVRVAKHRTENEYDDTGITVYGPDWQPRQAAPGS